MHLKAQGVKLTPAIAANLSEAYHRRTDSEDEMLGEMGQLATLMGKRHGGGNLPRRIRKKQKVGVCRGNPIADATGSSSRVSSVSSALVVATAVGSAKLALANISTSDIVQEASAVGGRLPALPQRFSEGFRKTRR